MIECECCGRYFHPDEINLCPECSTEVCPRCYDNHVNKCLTNYNDDYERKVLDIPRECPECDSELELDVCYDNTTLICPNCDFSLDVTDKFNEIESEDDYE